MTITHVYAGDITKTETTDDGDLLVWGKATGPDLDLDEQRCDPTWLKSAMPGWAQWANIREQHSAIAAGVGVETVEDGDDWYVKSLVVDEGSAKKVRKGVLKGYSVGIRNARVIKDATAPGGRIVGGEIVEISLVDRPCNPTATMAIAKSADGALAPVDTAGELVMDLTKAVIVDQAADSGARPYLKTALAALEPRLRAEMEKALADAAPAPFDRDTARADVAAILAGTRPAVVLNKDAAGYDETADIAGALDVIRGIAALIASEARSLGEGRLEESYDIGCLLDAVRAMKWFLECERAQDAGPADAAAGELTYVDLSVTTDLDKSQPDADAPTARTDSNKSATLAVDQGTDPDHVTLVKALTASKERIAALEADLAKAKAQPAGGGPAITRVTPPAATVQTKQAHDAAYYRRMADTVQDPQARTGYLQLAKQAAADQAGQ